MAFGFGAGLGAAPASLTSTKQFNRKWSVTVDTVQNDKLDIKFKVEKSLKDEPNKCELEIVNLSEDHRAQLEHLQPDLSGQVSGLAKQKVRKVAERATSGIPVKIEAGYEEDSDLSLIWLGDLRTIKSVKQGPDWVTTLESGDGEKAWQNARINVSFGPKTPVETVIRAIVKELGLGQGNLPLFTGQIQTKMGAILPRGTVVSGQAASRLHDWCRSCGLEFSIQDGAIQLLDPSRAVAEPAFLVSTETGMVESPTVDIDGLLHVKMLMPHDIRPGRLLVVDAQRVKGNYRIEKLIYEADSAGGDWYVDIEGIRI